ncbi:ATP-dependent DNA ligase [Streptomyces sp. NPDC048018]|uniref:ATP-dependent DNA ligase n=1 Tax=Streptomyces sp. NPDC048018 TaxID=3365499 RepID=UPI00371EF172
MSRETCRSPENDGYRCLKFTPTEPVGPVLLQSRRGSMIQARFPDLVRAAVHLPAGLVLDGELVVWHEGRFSFEVLQRRAASGGRASEKLAVSFPAHYVAFDVLQLDGRELLTEPYERRRALLESLFSDCGLGAPWTLCLMTTDHVVAPPAEHHGGDRRSRHRQPHPTTDPRPGPVRRRRHSAPGRPYRAAHTGKMRQMAGLLHQAATDHPWTGVRFSSTWGSREALVVVLVQPELVAEVDADTAINRGAWRHPLRLIRPPLGVTLHDVPRFGEGTAPAAG